MVHSSYDNASLAMDASSSKLASAVEASVHALPQTGLATQRLGELVGGSAPSIFLASPWKQGHCAIALDTAVSSCLLEGAWSHCAIAGTWARCQSMHVAVSWLRNGVAPEVRQRAAKDLGMLARPLYYEGTAELQAVEALVEALQDSSPAVRRCACEALGDLAVSGDMEAHRAMETHAAKHPDPGVRCAVAMTHGRGLARRFGAKPLEALAPSLQDENAEVRAQAALALPEIAERGPDEAADVEAISAAVRLLLADSDPAPREAAVQALIRLSSVSDTERLVVVAHVAPRLGLSQESGDVAAVGQAAALRLLAAVGAPPQPRNPALDGALRCVQHPDACVRKAALDAMETISFQSDPAVAKANAALLSDDSPTVRQSAAAAVAERAKMAPTAGNLFALATGREIRYDDEVFGVCEDAFQDLVSENLSKSKGRAEHMKSPKQEAGPGGGGELASAESNVRVAAIQLLGRAGADGLLSTAASAGGKKWLEPAAAVLKEANRDWRYRLAVEAATKLIVSILGSEHGREERALQLVTEALKDSDQRVCTQARAALAQLAEREFQAAVAVPLSRSASPTKDGALGRATQKPAAAAVPMRKRTGTAASKQQKNNTPQQGRRS